MAFQLLIDGYNLIGGDGGLRGNLERKRNDLVGKLQRYRQIKDYPITVVFDGWRSGWAREAKVTAQSITVIYSRQGETADSVIVRLARELGSGCVVVTSDREVRRAVEAIDAIAIYAGEFNLILTGMDHPFETDPAEPAEEPQARKGNPKKLSRIERRRRERLKKLAL